MKFTVKRNLLKNHKIDLLLFQAHLYHKRVYARLKNDKNQFLKINSPIIKNIISY